MVQKVVRQLGEAGFSYENKGNEIMRHYLRLIFDSLFTPYHIESRIALRPLLDCVLPDSIALPAQEQKFVMYQAGPAIPTE